MKYVFKGARKSLTIHMEFTREFMSVIMALVRKRVLKETK